MDDRRFWRMWRRVIGGTNIKSCSSHPSGEFFCHLWYLAHIFINLIKQLNYIDDNLEGAIKPCATLLLILPFAKIWFEDFGSCQVFNHALCVSIVGVLKDFSSADYGGFGSQITFYAKLSTEQAKGNLLAFHLCLIFMLIRDIPAE